MSVSRLPANKVTVLHTSLKCQGTGYEMQSIIVIQPIKLSGKVQNMYVAMCRVWWILGLNV
jgi:hypothetical protein